MDHDYQLLAGYKGRAHDYRLLEGEDSSSKSFLWYATEDMLGLDPNDAAYELRALIDKPEGASFEAGEGAATRVLVTNVEVSDQDHEVAGGIKTVTARLAWLEP